MIPRVSIVVPSRAVDAEIRAWTTWSFKTLREYTPYDLHRLIVVENVTDSMIGMEYDPGIYIHTAEAGLSRAVNMGIRVAMESEYVCISGTDVFYTPDWLGALIEVYEYLSPHCAVLSPCGIGNFTFDEHWWACVLIRSEHFKNLGLLDEETFPWTYADQDWDCRARNSGLQICRTGLSQVKHVNCATRSRVKVPDETERDKMIARWGYPEFNEWAAKRKRDRLPE